MAFLHFFITLFNIQDARFLLTSQDNGIKMYVVVKATKVLNARRKKKKIITHKMKTRMVVGYVIKNIPYHVLYFNIFFYLLKMKKKNKYYLYGLYIFFVILCFIFSFLIKYEPISHSLLYDYDYYYYYFLFLCYTCYV